MKVEMRRQKENFSACITAFRMARCRSDAFHKWRRACLLRHNSVCAVVESMAYACTRQDLKQYVVSWASRVQETKDQAYRKHVAMKAAGALLSTHRKGILEFALKTWEHAVENCQYERELGEVHVDLIAAKHQREESIKRVLITMTKGDVKILSQSVLVTWYSHLAELRKDREHAARMLTVFAGSEAQIMFKITFGAWIHLIGEQKKKQAKILQKEELMRKAMASLACRDDKVMTRNVFVTWNQHVAELQKERVHAQRLLTTFASGESRVFMGITFGAWFKFLKESHARMRQQKNQKFIAAFANGLTRFLMAQAFAGFIQMRSEVAQEKKMKFSSWKEEETMRKFLQAMANRDAKVMTRNAFLAWEQLVRQMDSVRLHEESMRKVLVALTHDDKKVVTRNTFTAWRQHLQELHTEAVHAKRLMMTFISGDSRALTGIVFGSWSQLLAGLHKAQASHQQQEESMRKVLAAMSHSDAKIVRRNVFMAWNQHLVDRALLEWNIKAVYHKQDEAWGKILSAMSNRNTKAAIRSVFFSWNQYVWQLDGERTHALRLSNLRVQIQLRSTFGSWAQLTLDSLYRSEIERLCRKETTSVSKILGAMSLTHNRTMTSTAFHLWAQLLVELHRCSFLADRTLGTLDKVEARLCQAIFVQFVERVFTAYKQAVAASVHQRQLHDFCQNYELRITRILTDIHLKYLHVLAARVFVAWDQLLVETFSKRLRKARTMRVVDRAANGSHEVIRLSLCIAFGAWRKACDKTVQTLASTHVQSRTLSIPKALLSPPQPPPPLHPAPLSTPLPVVENVVLCQVQRIKSVAYSMESNGPFAAVRGNSAARSVTHSTQSPVSCAKSPSSLCSTLSTLEAPSCGFPSPPRKSWVDAGDRRRQTIR